MCNLIFLKHQFRLCESQRERYLSDGVLLGEVLEGTGHVGLRQEKLPASGALPTTLVLGKPEKAREHIYIIHTISILSILTSLLQTAVQLLPALGSVGRGRLDAMFVQEMPAGGLQIG